ncbi:hypothetical protein B5M09_000971 [Aphanomyces astaci]|uniref:Uncharacterized protein n=1 Tax=Aphanomyces astaci TaxID=112090 RepID=A0A3R7WG16_APHAT|nr:hypothetical protein B5M09_000971 [Aphanomyces astaci]
MMAIDSQLTTLSWTPTTTGDIGWWRSWLFYSSPVVQVSFESVTSIERSDEWPHALTKPAAPEVSPVHGVWVDTPTLRLWLQCHDEAEQVQVVTSFQRYVQSAKKRTADNNMSIDAHLTLLTWSPLLSSPDARQASSAQTLELEDVVSIVPWTHKMPTKKPSAAELEMASKGGCWYFGVCVAYTKQQRPQQLMLLCHNAAEQEQLVLSFRTLIRNAKQRRSSLQLADAARLTPGMTASHMTPTQPAMPSHHIPLLVRR